MIKKSFKYLLIISVNFIVLVILLEAWVDDYELTFNQGIYFYELFQLIGLSIILLFLLRIMVAVMRALKFNAKQSRIITSIAVALLLSSWFYIQYTKRICHNNHAYKKFRKELMQKVKPIKSGWEGSQANNLCLEEYQYILQTKSFPKIPNNAKNISYEYEYEGFLPDYSFSLIYDVPIASNVEIIDYKKNTFSKTQTFEIVENVKRVTYTEFLW